jgi:hypothetical protein
MEGVNSRLLASCKAVTHFLIEERQHAAKGPRVVRNDSEMRGIGKTEESRTSAAAKVTVDGRQRS